MANADRTAASAVAWTRQLQAEPDTFDFYQALRCIDAAHQDLPPIGSSTRFSEDAVAFGQEPDLRFASTTLASFRLQANGQVARLAVNFFGLLGPNGPLPLHLTEFARQRIDHRCDPTFARFLDIFHHRTLSLFYRAWAVAQPVAGLDRPASDRFSTYVASSFGCGLPSLQNRDRVADLAKRHYAGLLAGQTRHARGLQTILQGYLQLPVTITEFVGHWLTLSRSRQWCLGAGRASGVLGNDTVLGERVWDYQSKFRISIGPMPFAAYQRLLPDGASIKRVRDWVRLYVGDTLVWELNLILQRTEVPQARLGECGLLGWTTWLGNYDTSADTARIRFTQDAADLSLAMDAMNMSSARSGG